jgi:hypothetical protein
MANLVFITIAVGLVSGHHLRAQDTQKSSTRDKAADVATPASPEKPKLTQEELEAEFKATLTRATLAGRWCLIKDGALGPEKEDKYTISSVMKLGADAWLINARIQYGKRDITAPIPVKVKWAGDTPVLIVDTVGVPGGGPTRRGF